MKAETEKKIEQLYDQGNLGYAYIFPKGSERWDERLTFHLSPENIANVLMGNAYSAEKVVVTDMLDNLVCDSMFGGFLNHCPDQNLCKDIVGYLAPIQMGETEVKDVLSATDAEMNEYLMAEDEMITSYEISMM
ncbi:MAG: resolvase [Clostridia bacterium]